MFTGLIQEVGSVRSVRPGGGGADVEIAAPGIGPEAVIGESIAVNGTCLTVERSGDWGFVAHAGAETLERTTVGGLRVGSAVNLERALAVGDRLGGHFVQGHVDCVGEIVRRSDEGSTVRLDVEIPGEYARYVVEKGSVAIDGISLTVTEITGSRFGVAIIPHTLANTTLEQARHGQVVNVETDILAKYVMRLLGRESPSDGVSRDTLAEHGFI
ncbi:MAG: riboflavin synthase [Armatimonadota bacterium]|jgi:riboflavin synthase